MTPPNSTIPTPRTDAESYWTTFEDGFFSLVKCLPNEGRWTPIEKSRQLERELSLAQQRIKTMANLIWNNRWMDNGPDTEQEQQYRDIVGMCAEIRSGNYEAIDTAITNSMRKEGTG